MITFVVLYAVVFVIKVVVIESYNKNFNSNKHK